MKLNKQYLLNNLWFGENQRQRVSPQLAVAGALIEPDYFRIWGTDHSGHWDGNVDFRPMVERGAKFTFIKCIDGTVASPLYYENRDRARALGMITGPYGWLYRNSNVPGKAQARAYWERIKNEKIQLPPTIDFEWTKYMGQWSNPNYADLHIHAEELVIQSGRKSILYSAPGFISPLGPIPKVILELIEAIWIAQYGVITPDYAGWSFHQFSAAGNATLLSPNDTGKLEVDLNYCKDLQTLYRLAGQPTPPPDPEEPMPITIKEGTVSKAKLGTATKLQIRSGSGASYQDIGDLFPNDKVYGQFSVVPWLEFSKIIRADGRIELLHGFATSQYMDLRDVPVEPPTEPPPAPSLPVLQVTVSGDGYTTQIVELKPK